tara:strand:+ start:33769 stop:34905 length:1137 start_codon:yes stop_codon:yes gene_type:complete
MLVCHIINSLNNGGAENILLKICKYSNKDRNKHYVISLIANGDLDNEFKKNCNKLIILNFHKNVFFIFQIFRLFKIIKEIKPDIIHGWMYHSSLLASLCGFILKIKNIHWNIRHTELILFKSSFITILIAKFMSFLSKNNPKKIVYCSEESKKFHSKFGFNNKNSTIINNGVDINIFKKSEIKKNKIIEKLNITDDEFIIGMIANYRPQKNHKFFIKSIGQFKNKNIPFKVILAGRNINKNNKELKLEIKKYSLEKDFILLDNINDVDFVLNTLDIFVLTSNFGESFSNVLIESMATSVPCITTNIGASAFIIKNCGWILNNFSEIELANLLNKVYKEKSNKKNWKELKYNNRKRVENHFSLPVMIEKYEKIWNNTYI